MVTGFQDSVGWFCHHSFLHYSVLFSNFSLQTFGISIHMLTEGHNQDVLLYIYSSVKRDVPISSFTHIPFFGFASMLVQSCGGWSKHQ